MCIITNNSFFSLAYITTVILGKLFIIYYFIVSSILKFKWDRTLLFRQGCLWQWHLFLVMRVLLLGGAVTPFWVFLGVLLVVACLLWSIWLYFLLLADNFSCFVLVNMDLSSKLKTKWYSLHYLLSFFFYCYYLSVKQTALVWNLIACTWCQLKR